MAKYVYGNTLIAFEVAKSNDVATELQAVQTMSAAEEIRTDDAIKFPAGEGNDIRITENAAQRIDKVLAFDASGDLVVKSVGDASVIIDAGDLPITDAGGYYTGTEVEAALQELKGYKEGTWTPNLYGATAGAFGISAPNGTYVRTGSLVTLHSRIVINSIAGVSGVVRLDGLPYGINSYGSNAIKCSSLTGIVAGQNIVIDTASGVDYLKFNIYDATTGVSLLDASKISATTQMSLSITYKTTDPY